MLVKKKAGVMVPAHQEITRKRADALTVGDRLPLRHHVEVSVTYAKTASWPRRLPRVLVTALGLSPTYTRVSMRFSDGSQTDWRASRRVRVLADRTTIAQLVA